MTVTPIGAANAYAAAQRLAPTQANKAAAVQANEQAKAAMAPEGFGELVNQAVTGTLDTGRAAEAKALEMSEGKASVVDVVTAVAETEVAVETLVTVRDKVISAYKDIMNMPI